MKEEKILWLLTVKAKSNGDPDYCQWVIDEEELFEDYHEAVRYTEKKYKEFFLDKDKKKFAWKPDGKKIYHYAKDFFSLRSYYRSIDMLFTIEEKKVK